MATVGVKGLRDDDVSDCLSVINIDVQSEPLSVMTQQSTARYC